MNSLKKILCLLAAAAMASACVRDVRTSDGPKQERAEQALVTLHVRVPSPSLATRATSTALENDIKTLALFLATDTDNDGVFHMESLVVVDPSTSKVDETTSRIIMELNPSATPVKFIAIANMDPADLEDYVIAAADGSFRQRNLEVEDWKKSQTASLFSLSSRGMMPMAGEAIQPFISARQKISLHIPLLRCVARADLKLNLGSDSKSFAPVSAAVYRAWSSTVPYAAASAYDSASGGRVIAPSFLASYGDSTLPITPVSLDASTGLFASAYLAESIAPETTALQTSSATCIVVGGYYNGASTESFYRIDFNSGFDGHPFGQILRNWQYVFNITKVNAVGYPTAVEAANNPANSITMEVEMWDENVQEVNFVGTGDYMYVNTNSAILSSAANSQKTFMVRSTIPFTWQLNSGTSATSAADQTVSDTNYSVTITSANASGSAYTDYLFTVSALSENTGTTTREESVFITAQGATLTVKLTQEIAKTVTYRKINVMSSGTSYGSYGSNVGTTAAGMATQMKSILLNTAYFGTSGKSKCGGFNFVYTDIGDFTTTAGISQLTFDLENIDVLNMCYSVNPTAAASTAICEWLWADPKRVLIVSRDNGSVNHNLISELNTRVGGTLSGYVPSWSLLSEIAGVLGVSTYTPIEGLAPASVTDSNRQFLAGPLGTIPTANMNKLFDVGDTTASGAIPGSNLIPLVWYGTTILTIPTRSSYISLAVDTKHRIVYLGDSNLVHDQMEGSATAPLPDGGNLNIILSNVWAWIVGVVNGEAD